MPMDLMMKEVPALPAKPVRVAVIGGGFAGLAAAAALRNLHANVTLYEARTLVGGRVESTSSFVPNRILEKGAELIGSNHVLWTFIASKLGLGLSVITEDDLYIGERLRLPTRFGGRRLSATEARSLYDSMKLAIGDLTTRAQIVTEPYNPWRTPGAQKLDATTLESWIRGITSDSLVRSALEFEFANNNAVATKSQSLLANLTQISGGGGKDYWEDTEVYRCENGNAALATGLKDYITSGLMQASVLLSEVVTEINLEGGEITVISKPANASRAARSTRHDYLVLAVPPTVWSGISFSGRSFPLGRIQSGAAIKYLAETKTRYWIRQGDAPSAVDDELGMLWEGTDNQMGGTGIDLSVFAGGPWAASIPKGATDNYMRPRLQSLLPGFLGPNGVVQSLYANWPDESFIRTGYSCPAPRQVTTLLLWMQQAIGGRIFLAGEHVSPPFFGYMEGALQSGLAAACRIAAAAQMSIPAAFGTLTMPGVQVQLPPVVPRP
jgi:monoamine oxidase